MNSTKYICISCDSTFDSPVGSESTRARRSFDRLPEKWQCPSCAASVDPEQASLLELVDNIETTLRDFTKQRLPHLSSFISRIAAIHEDAHPELQRVSTIFDDLKGKLEQHLRIEEETVFPLCREIISYGKVATRTAALKEIMRVLEQDLEQSDLAIKRIRGLLRNYVPPSDACDNYHTLLAQLSEFEKDLQMHLSKENYVLYPGLRAIGHGQIRGAES